MSDAHETGPESVPGPGERPRRNDALPWREVGGRVVVLSADGSLLTRFNATGSAFWRLADGSRTLGEIAREVAGEFEVEEAVVLEDLRRFLADLRAAGLLAGDG